MGSSPPSIGVLTGLPQERDCLAPLPPGRLRVACSTGRPENARRQVQGLLAGGCEALVSFGICGALRPAVGAGDTVIADRVIDAGGTVHAAAADWSQRIAERLVGDLPVHVGTIFGSERLISETVEKAELWRRYGAIAIDMESHVVAAAAGEANVPFVVIRVVADIATLRLPEAARVELDTSGNPRYAAVAGEVLRRPLQIADLIRVALGFRVALGRLRRCAVLIGSDLRFLG